MSLEKVVYTAKAKATGGRDGRATSSDGVLDVKLGVPKEMGGMGVKSLTQSSCLLRATLPASWAQ